MPPVSHVCLVRRRAQLFTVIHLAEKPNYKSYTSTRRAGKLLIVPLLVEQKWQICFAKFSIAEIKGMVKN